MKATPEQQTIIDYVIANDNNSLTKVNSVAGSGKTTLLITIAKQLPVTSKILYLAYNSSIAKEAVGKFPKHVDCRTTHSLAYATTVTPFKWKVDNLTQHSVVLPPKSRYSAYDVINTVRAFCLSAFTSFEEFAEATGTSSQLASLVGNHLAAMGDGKIPASHEFYLKYYHIMLAEGDIEYEDFDLLMIDEAGDVNEVTLEIFKLLPAKRKLMVGDPHQNIYQFNNTINAFEVLKDEGKLFPMTQSWRVNVHIAEAIELYCRRYLHEDMHFRGVPTVDKTINTVAYITRANGSLIDTMITMHRRNIPYRLVREPKDIFALPLAIASIRDNNKIITSATFKHMQPAVNYYFDRDKRSKQFYDDYKTVRSFLAVQYEDDIQLQSTIKLIDKIGVAEVFSTYKTANELYKLTRNCNTILSTAHSMKGLEVDVAVLHSDMSTSVEAGFKNFIDAIHTNKHELPEDHPAMTLLDLEPYNMMQAITPNMLTPALRESINLYYVACSRARVYLNNAVLLPEWKDLEDPINEYIIKATQ